MDALRTLLLATAAAGGLTLGACATAPSAQTTGEVARTPAAPARFAATPEDAAGVRAQEGWIARLGAPEVAALVQEAFAAGPDLAETAARVRQAEALSRQAASARALSLEAGASATRTDLPVTTPAGTDRVGANAFGLDLTASWEADLWGRLSDTARAARLGADAARLDLMDARVALAGRVARAAVDLAEADAALVLARTETETRQRVLALTQRRYAAGLVRTLDLRTARSSVASTEAAEADAERVRGFSARALEVLLGRYPGASARLEGVLVSPAPLPPPGTPSDLLAARPDVRAAEVRLTAAGLEVRAARRALLPSLRLTGTVSSDTDEIADLIDPERIAARLIASLAAPLLDGGARRAEIERRQAERDIAVTGYVRTTLGAWREVEDALAADTLLARREEAIVRAADESRAAEVLAVRQYGEGLISLFEVLDAAARRLDAERLEIAVRAQRLSTRIDYHVALGADPFPQAASGDPS